MSDSDDKKIIEEKSNDKIIQQKEKPKLPRYSQANVIQAFLTSQDGIQKLLDLGREFNVNYMPNWSINTIVYSKNDYLNKENNVNVSMESITEKEFDNQIESVIDLFATWADKMSLKKAYDVDTYTQFKIIEDYLDKKKEKNKFSFLY